jgi:pimeloyl-ACP methyl ester carboxylesterase
MANASNIYKNIDNFKIKSLVIWGAEDKVVPISGLEELQKDISYIFFKEIKEGTHDITYRQPTQVGSFLKEFIEN